MSKAELRARTNVLKNSDIGLSDEEIDWVICEVYHMSKDGFPKSFIRQNIIDDATMKSAVIGLDEYSEETYIAEHQRLLLYLGQYDG